MRIYLLLLFSFYSLLLHAQSQFAPGDHLPAFSFCGQHQQTQQLLTNHPEAQAKQPDSPLSSILKNNCDTNRVIPIVFHLIHMCGAERISKAQIDSALMDVNHCYNKTNWDLSYVLPSDPHYNNRADVGLTFKLAELDPYGNPTTGITETETSLTHTGAINEGAMKRMISWDRSRYLNVWVVNSTGVFAPAFAYRPPSVDNPIFDYYDGIVNSHFVLGRTGTAINNYGPNILTHEIGHWLNLMHTWGSQSDFGDPLACDDDDGVADTPNTSGNTPTDCPSGANDSCPGDGPDNQYNFMDYACEVMFTEGQKTRMYDCLCNSISQRDQVGTALSNQTTFLPNPGPRMLTKQYAFQESKENDGTIGTTIEITLTTGSFVSNMINGTHFTVSGLPAGLSAQITGNGNIASVELNGSVSSHSAQDNVTGVSIAFLNPAFSGISSGSLYKTSVDGLEIQFQNPGRLLHNSFTYTTGAPQCISPVDGQYTFWNSVEGSSMGMVFYQPKYYLYYNTHELEILCLQGTSNIASFQYGVTIQANMPGYNYQPILAGNPNDPNEVVLWSPTHTVFEDQLSYAIIRYKKSCNSYGYGWMSFYVEPGGNSACVVDMVYHQNANTQETTGVGNCIPGGNSANQWIERIELNSLANTSGDDGGYADYTSQSVTIDPATGADFTLYKGGFTTNQAFWKIWIDFNGNGSFNDPGERVYSTYESGTTATVSETNYPLVPSGTPSGNYKLRVGISFYEHYNPCQFLDFAEFEDYTITIGGGTTCATPPISAIDHNFAGASTVYLLVYPYSGVLHQLRYRETGATTWIDLPATTSHYSTLNPISLCTDYEAQLRVDCNGQWSAYSTSYAFTIADDASDIQLLLEGPMDLNTGNMKAALYDDGLLPGMTPTNGAPPTPSGQPYHQSPWNYPGTEGQNFNNQDYQNIETSESSKPVDWVLLSFRTGTAASTQVEQTAALLLANGTIFLVGGCLNLTVNQGYHIVIEHRNHLAIMSSGLVNYSNGAFTLQLTGQPSYGGGSKQLSTGDYVLWAADVNGDGGVSAADRSAVWNARNTTGYLNTDVNMDGVCNASDRSYTWNNRNAFDQVPN